ncbi:hypothetical protein ACP70R_015002 [Stipagrostis hirtigluma subsp. patula]
MDRPDPKKRVAAGLPDDALVEILSRLPVKSLHRSKCVAKAWRDLIDDPLNRKKLPQTLEGFLFLDGYIFGRCVPIIWEETSVSGGGSGGEEIVSGGGGGFVNFLARSVPLEMDPCLTYLLKLPEIEHLKLEDFCNGLLLFEHGRKSILDDELGYIVCNPITEQWVAVPTCGCPCLKFSLSHSYTYLAFDPAVSPHFHLVQFRTESWEVEVEEEQEQEKNYTATVHVYSSKTGMWSHGE